MISEGDRNDDRIGLENEKGDRGQEGARDDIGDGGDQQQVDRVGGMYQDDDERDNGLAGSGAVSDEEGNTGGDSAENELDQDMGGVKGRRRKIRLDVSIFG